MLNIRFFPALSSRVFTSYSAFCMTNIQYMLKSSYIYSMCRIVRCVSRRQTIYIKMFHLLFIWSPAGVSEDMDSYVDILVMVAIHSDMNILQEACYSLFPLFHLPSSWTSLLRKSTIAYWFVTRRCTIENLWEDFRKIRKVRNNEKSANFPILSRLKQGLASRCLEGLW